MTPKNWTLNNYTVSMWTDLVPAVSAATVIKSVSVAVGTNGANVSVRIANGGVSRALIIPVSACVANTGYGVDIPTLTLNSGDALQVKCDVSGVEFAAFGAQ